MLFRFVPPAVAAAAPFLLGAVALATGSFLVAGLLAAGVLVLGILDGHEHFLDAFREGLAQIGLGWRLVIIMQIIR